MKTVAVNLILWILASPIYIVKWVIVMIRRARFWATAYTPAIPCRTCGVKISLVGIWRCGCGYTYRGHLLRHCPLCGSLGRVVRCVSCGITHLLPEKP